MRPIGIVRSCWQDKFGIPRQAGLVPSATATIELDRACVTPEALKGLDAFSHIWVIFGFHEAHDVRMTVRPPRVAAARVAGVRIGARVGVLATRSPHRPNHLGLSAVRLVGIDALCVHVAGGDFLDGSPVYDIKPYLPYADAIDATEGWAPTPTPTLPVDFSPAAEEFCLDRLDLRTTVATALALDPRRPGARDGTYSFKVSGWDVKCTVTEGRWLVTGFALVPPPG